MVAAPAVGDIKAAPRSLAVRSAMEEFKECVDEHNLTKRLLMQHVSSHHGNTRRGCVHGRRRNCEMKYEVLRCIANESAANNTWKALYFRPCLQSKRAVLKLSKSTATSLSKFLHSRPPQLRHQLPRASLDRHAYFQLHLFGASKRTLSPSPTPNRLAHLWTAR